MIEDELYFWTCGNCGITDNWTFKPESEMVKDLQAAIDALKKLSDRLPEVVMAIRALDDRMRWIFTRKCRRCQSNVDIWPRTPLQEDLRYLARLMSMEKMVP